MFGFRFLGIIGMIWELRYKPLVIIKVWSVVICVDTTITTLLCASLGFRTQTFAGSQLAADGHYTFSVTWWSSDGRASERAMGSFGMAPMTELDWGDAQWIGMWCDIFHCVLWNVVLVCYFAGVTSDLLQVGLGYIRLGF